MIYTELNGIRDGKTCGVFYRYLHRRMWNWLADTHGRKYKKDWPEWAINGGIVPMAESLPVPPRIHAVIARLIGIIGM